MPLQTTLKGSWALHTSRRPTIIERLLSRQPPAVQDPNWRFAAKRRGSTSRPSLRQGHTIPGLGKCKKIHASGGKVKKDSPNRPDTWQISGQRPRRTPRDLRICRGRLANTVHRIGETLSPPCRERREGPLDDTSVLNGCALRGTSVLHGGSSRRMQADPGRRHPRPAATSTFLAHFNKCGRIAAGGPLFTIEALRFERLNVQSDLELVRDTLAGREQAFESLVKRYERLVRATAMNIVKDRHLAGDVAQESFVRAYRRLSTLHKPAAFGAWLISIPTAFRPGIARTRPPIHSTSWTTGKLS